MLPRMPAPVCLILACLALFGSSDWKLEPPRPVADGRPAENDRWRELSCAGCHENVAREWSRSTHATAWIDPRYQEELADKRKPEACHNCHIPEPLSSVPPGTKPGPRSGATHLGVDCSACHLGSEREILGPLGAATKAHASKQSPLFTAAGQSQLCVACHATNVGPVIGIAKDFVETGQAEKGRSCVGCHMQALEREFVADPASHARNGDAPYGKHAGRSHELQTPRDPAFLARAFEISARLEGQGTRLVLKNACGHRVPGLIGRELSIEVEYLDERGSSLGQDTLSFDHTHFLASDEEAVLEFGKPAAKLRLKGLHQSPGFEKRVLFLETEIRPAR
jgi:Cytochrome c554 and c-prime